MLGLSGEESGLFHIPSKDEKNSKYDWNFNERFI
jgi:hypothetical protein